MGLLQQIETMQESRQIQMVKQHLVFQKEIVRIFKLLQVDHYAITRELVNQIVSSCSECLVANPMTTKQPIRAIKTKHVRERFQVDCVDYKSYSRYNESYKFTLNLIDCYSKFI